MVDLGIEGFEDAEEVGRGGSARVYRAHEVELDRYVAIKVLHTVIDDDVIRRFERERRAMGRLSSHDGIVSVYSTGTTAAGTPYIVMPFFQNGSLKDVMDEGPLAWDVASGLIMHAARAMSWAHESGIVHRDLKPSNMLVADDETPKIADFGISRLVDDGAASRSTSLTFTPAFSPPEAFSTSKPSPASDVYGLGASLWALLTGRPPFTDVDSTETDLLQLMGRVVNEHVPAPAGVPAQIFAVIERSMAKDPADRYTDASAFEQALNEAHQASLTGDEAIAGATIVRSATSTTKPTDTSSANPITITVDKTGKHAAKPFNLAAEATSGEQTPFRGAAKKRASKRKPALLVAAAFLVLGAAGAGAMRLVSGGGDEQAGTIIAADGGSEDSKKGSNLGSDLDESGQPIDRDDDSSDGEPEEQTGLTVMGATVIAGKSGNSGRSDDDSSQSPATTTKNSSDDGQSETSPTISSPGSDSGKKDTTTTTAKASSARPSVSGLSVSAITSTSATVSFNSNVCTAAKYSYSGGSHQSTGYNANTACYQNHQAKLGIWTGALTPGKAYTVTVTIKDKEGRTATKSVSFTTKATAAPIPLPDPDPIPLPDPDPIPLPDPDPIPLPAPGPTTVPIPDPQAGPTIVP